LLVVGWLVIYPKILNDLVIANILGDKFQMNKNMSWFLILNTLASD